jgi:predicted extracellular nuclease
MGLGEGSMSTGFAEGSNEAGENGENGEASAGGTSGGTDSGAASSGSGGGIGGAASTDGGGAADAGGTSDLAGSAGSGSAGTNLLPPAILFSEYVEGSSSNKALEISATRDSVLDDCKVGAYFNGAAEPSVIAVLSGTLAAGHVLTLCTSTLKAKLGAVCDQVGRLTFNGNDAIALSCDGKVLDVFGQLGVDPGAAWGSGATTTADHSLRRKCSITVGDPNGLDPFEPNGEWQSFPVDTFSGLGSRGC